MHTAASGSDDASASKAGATMQTFCDWLLSSIAAVQGAKIGFLQMYPSLWRQSVSSLQCAMQKLRPVRDGDW